MFKKVHRIPIVVAGGSKGGSGIDSAPSPIVSGISSLILSANESDRRNGYSSLANFKGCDPNDIFSITSAIIEAIPSRTSDEATLAETALLTFLAAHASDAETINLVAQLSRTLSEATVEGSALWASLLEATKREISALLVSGSLATTSASRFRYALLRALESPVLRTVAAESILHILKDPSSEHATTRKAFAGQVLTSSRHLGTSEELQRVARTVFASGYAERRSALVATPSLQTPTPSDNTASDGSEEQVLTKAHQLVRKLIAPEGSALVPRLQPQDFQLLRKVSGLNLEVFRGVTDRIRVRAVSEPWARAAILDIVKAPHEDGVTVSIRTSVLGALVNEARRIGKLSLELEKEVFAVSAEFPAPIEPT